MNYSKQKFVFGRTILALALAAAFTPARADDAADLARLTQLTSSVSVGGAFSSGDAKDRTIFGQYNGLREHDSNLLLDFDYVKRNDRTGTWTIFRGRDLGLDTPELDFTVNRQGDWKFSANYEQIVKHDIRTINTGLVGAGSTTPTVLPLATPGTGQDVNLELKRKRLGLNVDKWITPRFQVQLSFKNEDKDGARLWGKGFACGGGWKAAGVCTASSNQWALLMLPEPVHSRTQQFEARLNYHTDKLFLSGGYYGSFYTDDNYTLTPTVPGTLYNILGAPMAVDPGLRNVLGQPMALWPDNQAHEFYIDGTYGFTPKVRSTFHVSYTHATQDDSFSSMGLTGAPAGVSSLNGERNTTIAQLGLTARPITKLSLVANLRYENRADETPLAQYSVGEPEAGPPVSYQQFTNDRYSYRKVAGKLEGTYRLPAHLLGTLGVDYQSINRDLPVSSTIVAGLNGLREKTEETTYRAQLRRSFSDTFSGSIGLLHALRTGSDWYNLRAGGGLSYGQIVTASQIAQAQATGGAFPTYLLDRKRDKVRATGEWTPTDRASIQLVVEDGRDHFDAPTYTGMQGADNRLYSLDVSYRLSYRWKLSGFISRSDQTMQVNQPSTRDYRMAMRDLNDTIGITVTGNPTDRLDVGAKFAYTNDRYSYDQSMGSAATAANLAFLAASGGLPEVTFRETSLNLYAKYKLDKQAAVRFDLLHQVDKLDEWTWGYAGVPFTYADNTTIALNPNQTVTVLMARYIYSFR